MSFKIVNGVLETTVDNVVVTHSQHQVVGYEQFVTVTEGEIIESLPSHKPHCKEYTQTIPAMTNNGHPHGGVYSSMSGDDRINAYKVFSRDTSSVVQWDATTGWVKYDALQLIFVTYYTITTPTVGDVNSMPYTWKLLGSNDDRNWVELDSRHYQKLDLGRVYSYTCQAPHSFQFIKLEWTAIRGNVAYTTLCNLDVYGVSRLGFNETFDANMPIITVDTEYHEELTTFPSVHAQKVLKYDVDPFNDGSLICYCPLDGSVDDVTGNLTMQASFTPEYVSTDDGQALNYIGGAGVHIVSTNTLPLATASGITTCAWVYLTVDNYYQWLSLWWLATTLNSSEVDRVQGLWFSINTPQILSMESREYPVVPPSDYVPLNEWVFLTIRQTRHTEELLLNGKVVAGATLLSTSNTLGDSYVYIGDAWYAKAHLIKDFRIFDRVLSDQEIFELQASGKTVSTLKGNKEPLAYTIFDTIHNFNGKALTPTLIDYEVIKTRKKFRFIDYRMQSGSSLNNYVHVDEVLALDENLNELSVGKSVVTEVYGTNNKQVITDGTHDNSAYYSSNTSYLKARIDLGEEKDIRYIQFWNYFQDNRTYNDIQVRLTNNPVRSLKNEEHEDIFTTEQSGKYTETSNGKTVSNLVFDYQFKVTYNFKDFAFPAKYTFELDFIYPRVGSRLYSTTFNLNRNLWHLRDRMLKSVKEYSSISDTGHITYPRVQVVSDTTTGLDYSNPSILDVNQVQESGDATEIITKVIVQGMGRPSLEVSSLFEVVTPIVNNNTIAKVISENTNLVDTTSRYLRYNAWTEYGGLEHGPLDYVANEERVTGVVVVGTAEIIEEVNTLQELVNIAFLVFGEATEDANITESSIVVIS